MVTVTTAEFEWLELQGMEKVEHIWLVGVGIISNALIDFSYFSHN